MPKCHLVSPQSDSFKCWNEAIRPLKNRSLRPRLGIGYSFVSTSMSRTPTNVRIERGGYMLAQLAELRFQPDQHNQNEHHHRSHQGNVDHHVDVEVVGYQAKHCRSHHSPCQSQSENSI